MVIKKFKFNLRAITSAVEVWSKRPSGRRLITLMCVSGHEVVGGLVLLSGVLHAEFELLEEVLVLVLVNVLAPCVCELKQTSEQFLLVKVVLKLGWLRFALLVISFTFVLRVVVEIFFDKLGELVRINAWSENHADLNENSEVLFLADDAVRRGTSPGELLRELLDRFNHNGVGLKGLALGLVICRVHLGIAVLVVRLGGEDVTRSLEDVGEGFTLDSVGVLGGGGVHFITFLNKLFNLLIRSEKCTTH